MPDYIPRSAALEAIEEERKAAHWTAQDMPCLGSCHDEYIVTRTLERVAMRLQSIPAADGMVYAEWISVPHKRARVCSRCYCDEPYKFAPDDADVYDFCPHCGAKMDKEE